MHADGRGFRRYITGIIAILLVSGAVAIIGCDDSITLTELGDGLDDTGALPPPVTGGEPDPAESAPSDILLAPASLDEETVARPFIIATPSRTLAGTWDFGVALDDRELREGLRFVWDFGDGQQRAGPEPSFAFTTSGLHRVTVTVFERVDVIAFVLTMDVGVPEFDTPPIADAGADQVVDELATVTLDAEGSIVSGDDPIAYEWSQISGPTVAVSEESNGLATFVAPEVEGLTVFLVFEVGVTQGDRTSTDRVVISVTDETLSSSVGDLAIGTTRSFRMGMTPFAEVTDRASEQRVWDFVLDHGDLVAIHIDPIGGLPWEVLEQGDVPSTLRAEFEGLASRLPSDRPVYVAINPLNTGRDGVTGTSGGGPFPAAMGSADFSNPRLHQAFINYARFIVETLRPTYLAVAIEVNMYALAPGADFASLVGLYKDVYRDLKTTHPGLIIFATFQAEFMNGFGQWQILDQFEPELDRVGLALYPSGVGLRPDEIPDDWIGIVRSVTDTPVVITETGYGTRPFFGTDFTAPGSEALQRDYVQWLVDQAEVVSLDFVVWFFPSDVSGLLPADSELALMPEFDDISFFFHMGLVESDYSGRPSLDIWRDNLSRPLQP